MNYLLPRRIYNYSCIYISIYIELYAEIIFKLRFFLIITGASTNTLIYEYWVHPVNYELGLLLGESSVRIF